MTGTFQPSDKTRLRDAFSDPNRTMLRIGSDNQAQDWVAPASIDDATPVACWPKDGLLVLDLDEPKHLRRAARLERHLDGAVHIIKWCSGGVTTTRRGKTYRRQQWVMVVPEGTTTETLRETCLTAGLPRGVIRYRQPSRAPLSAHRNGRPTELLHPASVDLAVEWMLGPKGRSIAVNEPDETPLEPIKPRRPDLPAKAWRLAEQGKAAGNYATGSHARFALARLLAEAGWDYSDYLAFILNRDYRIGDSEVGRERDPRTGLATAGRRSDKSVADRMLRDWNNAVRQSAGTSLRSSPASYDPLEHAFQVACWRDRASAFLYADERTKDSDRQLIETITRLMIAHQSWTILPGVRGLSNEANLELNTVEDALHRLEAVGALAIQRPADVNQTVQSNRLHINEAWLTGQSEILGGKADQGWVPDLQDPQLWLPVHSHIWDGKALGTPALRVYCELTRGWMTIPDLVAATGVSEKAVTRALKLLAEVGEELGESGPLVAAHSLSPKHRTWQAVPLHDPQTTERVMLTETLFGGRTIASQMDWLQVRNEHSQKGTLGAREWEASRRQAVDRTA